MTKLMAVLVWIIVVIETVAMMTAGASKFLNWPLWSGWFTDWGYGAWFAAVIGGIEIAGGVGLLVRRVAAYAAMLLLLVMLGALYTTLTKPNALGWTTAAIHAFLLALILAARWRVRWRAG